MKTAFKPFFALFAGLLTLTACNNDDDLGIAQLETLAITEVTSVSAKTGGRVLRDWSSPVSARGVVWSSSQTPDLESNLGYTQDGEGLGQYISVITGLSGNQTYYVRAYATSTAGTAYGQQIEFRTSGNPISVDYPPGTVHCIEGGTKGVEVFNPATGRTWMDRNLGAVRTASSPTDEAAYGDLYQWGRFSDGHQCRSASTTTTLSDSPTPEHGDFIVAKEYPRDWLSPQNDNLWQGVNGINNPCPEGFRLPTKTEWNEERDTWNSPNSAGAFGSLLKLTLAGSGVGSSLLDTGFTGNYSFSTVSGSHLEGFFITGDQATLFASYRYQGNSVRCIKD